MADINLRIVGTADMRQAQESINRLKASLAGLQAQYANTGSTVMFKGLKASINEFNQLNEASGRFKVHMLEAGTAADRLSERIRRNKTTYNDLHMAMQSVNKQGNVFLDIGKKTVAMQDAQAVRVGKTAYVYEDLGKTFASTGEKARVMSTAIAAQNQVLKEHAMNIINTGKNMQWTGRQLTMGITMPLVMFGAQVGKIFNEVDKNLTRLAKVYGVGLTQPTEQALTKIRTDVLALSNELARSLGVSSAEVTDIAAQFAAAGMQGKELINATRQASRAVVLGEADKQEAINATISLQTAYGLNTKELTEAINFFNAAQAATSTSMGDLINAIPRVGPVIKNLGGSYKDMVAILTALKEGGVPAGEAANAIKNSLSRIVAPTVAAQEKLKSFGIDLKAIVGKNAGDLTGTITELQTGLNKLGNIPKQQAITELFGRYQSARMTAFIENFNKAGSQSEKITKMMGTSSIELANIAERQTKKIQQSASGRFRIAVESMKNELIPFGEMFLNIFSNVAEKVIKVAEAIKELPSGLKTFIKIMAGLTALVGPAVMIFGIFKSMAGSLLQGAIRIKQFAGAMRQLFTGGGIEGFKTIWRGFKETDLVAEAATRAVEIFEAKAKGMPDAAGVFSMGIDKMIASLQSLSNQAAATGQSMEQIYGATSATAASTIPGNYRGANIRSGRLQGVGFHHMSDLAETNKRLGIDDSGRSRGRRSNDQVYGLINVTPGSMAGPEYQAAASQVGNLVYSNEQEKAMIQDRLDQYLRKYPSVSPEMRGEASKTLPRSLSQFSSVAATMPAQLEMIASAGTAAVQRFNQEMAKIVSAFDSQDAATSAAQVDALVQSIIASSGKEAEFAAKRQLNIKRITEAYRTGGKTAADAVIIEIEKEARAISSKAGLVGTAYGKGDSRGGGVRAALVSLASQLSSTIQEVIIPAVVGDFNMTSGKGYAQIKAEAEAQGRRLQEFTATNGRRYIADVTDGIEKAIIVELSKNNVISGNAVPLDVRGQLPLLENAGVNRSAMDRAAQARRAREELAKAKREGRVLTGLEAAGPNREAFDRAAEAKAKRREIIDARISDDIARVRSERLELERKDEQLKLKSKKPSVIGQKLASGMRVAGGVGFAATSTLQMMGMGNETTNLLGQGIGAASMMTGLVAGPWGVALQAAVAAMPLLIKGISALIEDSSRLGRAMSGAFKVSAFEAENLNITLNELGKAVLPKIGFGVAETSSKIEALSKQIEALGSEDPLKMFADSLKSQTVQDQIDLLQQKYLTLRIQGVDDTEARDFVKAIMRAAGVEYSAGFDVSQYMVSNKNQPISRMVGAQGRAMVGMTNRSVNGLLDAGDTSQYFQQFADQGLGAAPSFDNPFGTWGPGADAARKSVEALTQSVYDLLLNTPKDKLTETLKGIESEMKKSTDTTNLYTAAIREIYQQSGPVLSGYWESVKKANLSATEQLQVANIYFNGLIKNYNDLQYITKNPIEIQIRTRYIEEKENLAKATSGLASTLSKNALSQTYQAEVKSAAIANQKADAQQSVVDKLKDELDLRKKILDAQERELAFNDRMISLRQQYNEALATNDMAKAAELQRQMSIEQVKYNNELAKDAMDDKLSKQQKKAAAAQKSINQTAGSAKGAIENISEYSDKAMKFVYDALANDGKLATSELNKFAKELKDKFGVPISVTKQTIKDTLKEFQAQDVIKFATASANAFNTKWIPAQRKSAILAAFNSAVQTAESPESAMAHAIEVVMSSEYGGASVRATKTKGGGTSYIMTMPTGRGAYAVNVSTSGTVSDISPTYVTRKADLPKTSGQKLAAGVQSNLRLPGRAEGGHITGPGTGTSDSIPAYLSNGEYVIRASSVQKYGKETFDALNAQKFAGGGYLGTNQPTAGFGYANIAKKMGASAPKGYKNDFIGNELLGIDDFEWVAKNLQKGQYGEAVKSGLAGVGELGSTIASLFSFGTASGMLQGGKWMAKGATKLAPKILPLIAKIPPKVATAGKFAFKGMDVLWKGTIANSLINVLQGEASKEDLKNIVWGAGDIVQVFKGASGLARGLGGKTSRVEATAPKSQKIIDFSTNTNLLKENILSNFVLRLKDTEINQAWKNGGKVSISEIIDSLKTSEDPYSLMNKMLEKNNLDKLDESTNSKLIDALKNSKSSDISEKEFAKIFFNQLNLSKKQLEVLKAPAGIRFTPKSGDIQEFITQVNKGTSSHGYSVKHAGGQKVTVTKMENGKIVDQFSIDMNKTHALKNQYKTSTWKKGTSYENARKGLAAGKGYEWSHVGIPASTRSSNILPYAIGAASLFGAHKLGMPIEGALMASAIPGMLPSLTKGLKVTGGAARATANTPRPAQNSYAIVQKLVEHMRSQPGFDAQSFYKLGSDPTPGNAAAVDALKKTVYDRLVQSGKFNGTYDNFIKQLEPTLMHTQPTGTSWRRPTSLVQDVNRMIAEMAGVDPDAMVRLYRSINVSKEDAGYATLDAFYTKGFRNNGMSQGQVRYDLPISDLPNPLFFGAAPAEFAQTVSNEVLQSASKIIRPDRMAENRIPGAAGHVQWNQASRFGALFTRNPIKGFSTPAGAFKALEESGKYPASLTLFLKRVLVSQKNAAGGFDHRIPWMKFANSMDPELFNRLMQDYPQLANMKNATIADIAEIIPDFQKAIKDLSGKNVFSARVPSQIIPGILTPSQRGSLPALLNQIISGNYPSALKLPGAIEMLRGLTRRTPHAMDFFHGRMMNRRYIEGLNPGDQVKLDGPISTSMDMAVAQNFAERKAGAAFDGIFKAQYPGKVGPTRYATTEAEKLESLRKDVMDKIAGIKQSKAQMRALNEKISELTSPSDLFGGTSLTPMQIKELEKLQKELQHIELSIGNQKESLGYARQSYSRYRNDASVVIAMHTKDGVKYIPLSGVKDLNLPSQLNWKTLGIAQSEQEALMNNISGVFRSREQIGDRRYLIHLDQVNAAGFNKGGMVGLPKYHTGGLVNYAYGSEVTAMLQGGEVVIPKEIVRDLKNGAVSNSSVYNNTPNITVNVAGTNASPQDIANAVSQAMQRRQDMVRTRTVIG